MKRYLLLLLAFAAFPFFAAAQSLDRALEQLEALRFKNGEQSQEYLSALDTVVLKATMADEITTAFAYRKRHLDIVKQMKGEECYEVADDIWRLGNTSFMLGDSIGGCNYYVQAAEIFDKIFIQEQDINDDYLSHYSHCLYRTFTYYYAKSDIENFTNAVKKYERIKDRMRAFNPCYNLVTLYHFSYSYEGVGDIDKAVYFSNLVVESCNSIDSCNYQTVLGAFYFLESYYYTSNQHELQIQTATNCLNKLDEAELDFFDEKIKTLMYLLYNCISDVEGAIAYGKRAEQLLVEHYTTKDALYQDKRYFAVVSHIALLYDITSKYVEELPYRVLCINILKHIGDTNTKRYYDAVFGLFNCAFRGGEHSVVFEIAPELEPLIFSFSDEPTKDALAFTSSLATAYTEIGNYEEALHYYDETIGILPAHITGDALQEAIVATLSTKAELFNLAGKREEALSCLLDCKSRMANLKMSDNLLSTKIAVYQLEGQLVPNYEEAMADFDTAFFLCNQLVEKAGTTLSTYGDNSISLTSSSATYAELEPIEALHNFDLYRNLYAIALLNKGKTQASFGKIVDGYQNLMEAASILEQTRSNNSTQYLSCLIDMAFCQMSMANYSDAINTIDASMNLIKDLYGTDNPYYAMCLQNYAVYYNAIGAYDDAVRYCDIVVQINRKLFGESSWQYTQALGSAGSMYLSMNMPERAYQLISEALSLNEKYNNKFPPFILCQLNLVLATTMFELNRIEEGWEYYEKAKELTESIYGRKSRQYAKFAYDFGKEMLKFEKGRDVSYESFLSAAGALYAVGYKNDPLLLYSLCGYGVAGVVYRKSIASDYIQLTCNAVKDYYSNNLMFFSTRERDLAWASLSDYTQVIFSARTDTLSDHYLYDYLLFSKSLMLTTSDNYKNTVFGTGRQDLIDQYNNIQAVQRIIDNQNFSGLTDNQSPEQLYERKTSMERKLMAEMKALGYAVNDSITYNDVRKALKTNEIAIEFVDYYHPKDQKIYYVALLAKPLWDNPMFITLCTDIELKNCIGNPNVTYSIDDLYRLLWQPLAEYINEGDKVYFSPSGMLHTIALESLHTPDGSCLSDKYNFVRLSSTRELCKERQPKTYETGAVYGGLQYDVDQQRMTEVAAMNKTAAEESPVFALRGDDRGNWNYLQGTKDEVEHIAGIMRQANIGCELFEGDLGNEESFKALSGSNTDIIHLATHGYFIEGEKADMNDFMQSLSPLARQKADSVIDPLLRSGLILSGGNRAWLGQEVPEGIEDGVLTALEISTMNLSGTDMVVMSACETGLGDITSDGVFGLQRAFKMAGVQTLVMSLWKVDDNATSLMMQTFYEHLLSGMSKREAFNLAQAAVRAKYPEPYYWAGFIMLD